LLNSNAIRHWNKVLAYFVYRRMAKECSISVLIEDAASQLFKRTIKTMSLSRNKYLHNKFSGKNAAQKILPFLLAAVNR
jgi:hypothetical protein